MKLQLISSNGNKETLTASDLVFDAKVSDQLIAQAMRVYLANQRQGSSKVKTRSEINRTKKKWFKQKGTGNARHGAKTPSLFVGGGVAFGPNGEQNWHLNLSQKMKLKALAGSLTRQAENIVANDDLQKLNGKTAAASVLLKNLGLNKSKVLVVLPNTITQTIRSLRNLPNVLVRTAGRLNALEVAMAEKILIASEAVRVLEARMLPKEPKIVEAKVAKEKVVKEKVAKVAKTKVAKEEVKPAKEAAKAKKSTTSKKISK